MKHMDRSAVSTAKVRPLCIGYGNPLRGDDAVGPALARAQGGIAVHQLLPELAERIARERVVVFLDARADLAPGAVEVMPLETTGAATHSCSPRSLLRLAREVYGSAPIAVLIGIGAASFELGAPITPAARRGMREAARRIAECGLKATAGTQVAAF